VSERLFAYGTLRRGFAPDTLAGLVAGFDWEGEASVRGRLYDLGAYPGVVLDPTGGHRVHGEVARFDAEAALWELLDGYEGADARHPGARLFRRVRCDAQRAEGGFARVWLYEYARDPGAAALLPDGRYPPAHRRGTLGGPAGRTA
jgi:gamma-glutamylcyclotransferase (GGCT)/AIG2-like uncharacterized protein YtfP